jgi:hypothetical protein
VNRRVFLILSKSPSADVNAWDSPGIFLAEGDGLEYASSSYMLGADGGEHR